MSELCEREGRAQGAGRENAAFAAAVPFSGGPGEGRYCEPWRHGYTCNDIQKLIIVERYQPYFSGIFSTIR